MRKRVLRSSVLLLLSQIIVAAAALGYEKKKNGTTSTSHANIKAEISKNVCSKGVFLSPKPELVEE